jgi:predicted metal-dependent HD superfamily phosphohydrolase
MFQNLQQRFIQEFPQSMQEKALNLYHDEIHLRYTEKHRKYHTLNHLKECFDHFDNVKKHMQKPSLVAMAIWFHDIIYDPMKHDNELKSADLMLQLLKDSHFNSTELNSIHTLIMATKHPSDPKNEDEKLLIDIDLAILSTDSQRFSEYDQQIREEYSFVPEQLYNLERSRFLKKLITSGNIYYSDHFHSYNKLAISNLKNIS